MWMLSAEKAIIENVSGEFPIYQQAILAIWITYSCTMSWAAFNTEHLWMRKSIVQFGSIFIWVGLLVIFKSTLADELTTQFMLIPLAIVIGFLFMPYLVWMNAETIIAMKEHAMSASHIELKPTYDHIDRAIKMSNFGDALQLAQDELQTRPDEPELWLKIAEIHQATGAYSQSLEALDHAIPLAESKPEMLAAIYMRMVDLYWDHLDDAQKARELLTELRDMNLTERSARFATLRLNAIQKNT